MTKKLFIFAIIILISTSNTYAQAIVSQQGTAQKKTGATNVTETPNPYDKYRYPGYYRANHGYNRDYITLENIETKIQQLKNRIYDSEKYSDRKKASLDNELNHALRKLREADIDGNGKLDEKEQEIYPLDIYIDY